MASLGTVDIGDRPVITATFTSSTGVATDPTTVTFRHRTPDGTETSYVFGSSSQVVKTAVGSYEFTVPTITQSGQHAVRSLAAGAIVTAAESTFKVRPSAFASP